MVYKSHLSVYAITSLDVMGIIWLWTFAWAGYCLGLIHSWWRRWSIGILLFMTPMIDSLFYQGVTQQVIFVLLVIAITCVFVVSTEFYKKMCLALIFSFGVIQCISFLIFFPQMGVSGTPLSRQMEANVSALKEQYKIADISQIRAYGLKTRSSLLIPKDIVNVNWLDYSITFHQNKYVERYKFDELASKNAIESVWKNVHPEQVPAIFRNGQNKGVFMFTDAIYRDHQDPKKIQLWRAEPDEKINWHQVILFHLLSALLCFIYFYYNNRPERTIKMISCLLLGLPFFIACLITHQRAKKQHRGISYSSKINSFT